MYGLLMLSYNVAHCWWWRMQFERTLIVAEDDAYVSYLEGCTAPAYDSNQLHAAVVELSAGAASCNNTASGGSSLKAGQLPAGPPPRNCVYSALQERFHCSARCMKRSKGLT